MKTTTKKAPVKTIRKNNKKASSKRVPLAHQNCPVLRQLRLVERRHTGKILHHKNTSHLSLIMILLIFGLFLFASGQYARAIIQNGSVTVGLTVLGPAPKTGASITDPVADESFVDNKIIAVSGVCEKKSFVVVKSNGSVVGSTNCTEAGIFSLNIQLQYGDNILSALNYDNLNQAGPETPSITISLSNTTETTETNIITPVLPDNPSTVPGTEVTDCSSYSASQLPVGNEPHGSTVEPGYELKTCPICKGAGQVNRVMNTIFGPIQQTTTCDECGGRGKIPEKVCTLCHGKGTERRRKTINLKVPAGIDDGATIRLCEYGEANRNGQKGDLYVHIQVKAHKSFTREGDIILSEQHIDMVEAALGTEIDVETVDGRVRMKVPAGTQSGTDFKLSNHGVPHMQSDRRGPHIVSIIVDTPTRLTRKQREILEQF